MSILEILIAPDPVLKSKANPVAAVDDRLRQLADDMLETMYAAPGIGLAAPQVGVLERVIVCDVAAESEEPHPLCLFNPSLVWTSGDETVAQEGCLSIPDQYADVVRPSAVGIRYLDRDGAEQKLDAEGLLSRCLQHELDHLDGILFTDHLSALKRNMIMRKMAKLKKTRASEQKEAAG